MRKTATHVKQKIALLIIAFVLLWNSGFIGAEYGLPYTGPFSLIFWRYLAVFILLGLYLLARNRLRWVGTKTAAVNMLIGLLSHGVWLTCVLFALDNKVPAGIVALIVALQPLTTGALSGYVTNEKTNSRQWTGLIIGFIGVVITVAFRIDSKESGSVFGYLIPLASVAAITIATLIQRRIEIQEESVKLPMDLTLFYQSLGTLIAIAFPALLVENLATEWKPTFIYTLLWLIVAVSIGAYFLMWRLIEYLETTKVASLFYLGPPVTMLMGWLAFGDTVIMTDIIGMTVGLLGVILTQRK